MLSIPAHSSLPDMIQLPLYYMPSFHIFDRKLCSFSSFLLSLRLDNMINYLHLHFDDMNKLRISNQGMYRLQLRQT